MNTDFPKEERELNLTIHLLGKSTNSQLINLEYLSNLAAGLNGLAHHIVRTKVGKQRTNEEVKRLYTFIKSGLIGKLEHRKGIVDSVEYSKNLREEVFK